MTLPTSSGRNEHFAIFCPIGRSDDPPPLHGFNDFCSTIVPDTELALDPRSRAPACLGHDPYGGIVHRVGLGIARVHGRLVIVARLEDGVVIDGLALRPEEVCHELHLFLAAERAL